MFVRTRSQVSMHIHTLLHTSLQAHMCCFLTMVSKGECIKAYAIHHSRICFSLEKSMERSPSECISGVKLEDVAVGIFLDGLD
mmetsp:Transcript_18795/g.40697  ORF Transcript_18795/g.40697 Transcript_18795/m.40697 type:complete len:83 (+) Transcript_18795:1750-1998(+)